MPDESTIPACLGCDHQADHCEMCGGRLGTGAIPACQYCLSRPAPPVALASAVMVGENIIQVGPNYRAELGPRTKTEIATEELLHNDVTASHYVVGGMDAVCKPIVLGEPMTDRKSTRLNSSH